MAAACVGSAALARPFARGSVPDRADFCDAGWIQQSGARDEDVGPRPIQHSGPAHGESAGVCIESGSRHLTNLSPCAGGSGPRFFPYVHHRRWRRYDRLDHRDSDGFGRPGCGRGSNSRCDSTTRSAARDRRNSCWHSTNSLRRIRNSQEVPAGGLGYAGRHRTLVGAERGRPCDSAGLGRRRGVYGAVRTH